jgi:DNA replication and repair protein RecF
MAQRLAPVVSEPAVEPAATAMPGTAPMAAVVRLSLSDFRCYKRLRLDVDKLPVVLTGPNGAGKTNLLEAVSFLAPGRGLRRAKLAEADHRTAEDAAGKPWAVAAVLETGKGRINIGTGREPAEGALSSKSGASERRAVRIDGHPARGQKDLAQHLALVWLTPDMDRLFQEGSSARRRFLDRLVYGFHPEHAGEIAAYETVMRDRARLLADGATDQTWLDALEDGMARHGVAIAASRAAAARRLDQAAASREGPFPAARLSLTGQIDTWLAEMPAVAVEDRMRATLQASRTHDATLGGAACGPHRTDLIVRYAAKDRPARECSTGEQKALLLSILLAMARELAAERGEAPILLLDEVVAHLDGFRRAALFDEISVLGAQAWLTGTDDELFAGLRGRARFFRVLDATVMPR